MRNPQDMRIQVAAVLHLKRCQRKNEIYLDVLIQRLAIPLFVSLLSHSHLSTDSVVCRIGSARFGCDKYCIRTRWRPLLLLSYEAFNLRHASSPLLSSVIFTVMNALPLRRCAKLSIVLLKTLLHDRCGCDLAICQRNASIVSGFVDPMYAVN